MGDPVALYKLIVDAAANLARDKTTAAVESLTEAKDVLWYDMTGEQRDACNRYVKEEHNDVW